MTDYNDLGDVNTPALASPPPESELYHALLHLSKENLIDDIENWERQLDDDLPIDHHLRQFREYCIFVSQASLPDTAQDQSLQGISVDQLDRQQLVLGILTAQWLVLRQVVAQRIAGSPYLDALKQLDEIATGHFYRLYNTLSEAMPQKNSHVPAPPLVYLGRIAELAQINPNLPDIISIPFGAAREVLWKSKPEDEKVSSIQAIAHEVGHAVFNRFDGFLPALEQKIRNQLQQQRNDDSELKLRERRISEVLHDIILNWLEEIVADLAGTTLGGVAFARNAVRIMTFSAASVSPNVGNHPVSIIRPIIHFTALEYLVKHGANLAETEIKSAREYYSRRVSSQLKRPFEAFPILADITLKDVGVELGKIATYLLNCPVDPGTVPGVDSKTATKQGATLGEVLVQATMRKPDLPVDVKSLSKWGRQLNNEDFLLEIPATLLLDFALPVAIRPPFCDIPIIGRFCR